MASIGRMPTSSNDTVQPFASKNPTLQASTGGIARLNLVPERALAKLYLFTNGVKGPNPFGFQANVVDSVPGEPGYSPLWRVYAVTWSNGATAKLLTSESDILALQKAGKVTIKRTPLIKNSPIVPSGFWEPDLPHPAGNGTGRARTRPVPSSDALPLANGGLNWKP